MKCALPEGKEWLVEYHDMNRWYKLLPTHRQADHYYRMNIFYRKYDRFL